MVSRPTRPRPILLERSSLSGRGLVDVGDEIASEQPMKHARLTNGLLHEPQYFLNKLERAPGVHGALVDIDGVMEDGALLRTVVFNRLELLPKDLDGSGNQRITAPRTPVGGDDGDRFGILVETVAKVVDILRFVPSADRVRLHDDEVGERRHSQAHRVRRARDHHPFELDALRPFECRGAGRKLEDPEAFYELGVILLAEARNSTSTCTGASPSPRSTVVTS